MLRRLQRKLHIFLVAMLMSVISLILCFSFWLTWQNQQATDSTHLQRMASLAIYQLESDPAEPDIFLSEYENEMRVYSLLRDASGNILFESKPDTPTTLHTLEAMAKESITIQPLSGSTLTPAVTEQGGYVEITGDSHDRYYVIPANISTKAGNYYSLTMFYEQMPLEDLLYAHLPAYLGIWLLAFLCVLLLSRFFLQKAFEPTEKILQSQKDFVAAASHELKSPLAVVMAKAEHIQNTITPDASLQSDLKVMDSECLRMSRLIQDMLLLASSDADQCTIQAKETNIDTLLITLYEAFEPVCRKKSIQLHLQLSDESYPVLYTDQERLFQILSIFLDNAICYSPENGSIEIQTRQSSKELTFSIVDHGTGISGKDRPFIFDRFYCADKSRTDKAHVGLGLSIAKELSRMLNGKIGFDDTKGGGATFFLTLPKK